MKSLKKVLALTTAIAMLGTYAAGAASVEITGKENGSIGNFAEGDITVEYKYTPDAGTTGNSVTIIAFEDDSAVELASEVPFSEGKEIAYINQAEVADLEESETANEDAFTFKMRDGLVADLSEGKYFNVFVGGTNVAVADRAMFSYGTVGEDATTYKVSGTIGNLVNFGDEDQDCIDATEAFATVIDIYDIQDGDFGDIITSYSVPVDSIDPMDAVGTVDYEIDYDFEIGKAYGLVAYRAGVCPKMIYLLDTIDEDVTCDIELLATDTDESFGIDGSDINAVVTTVQTQSYETMYDAVVDYALDGADINAVVANAQGFNLEDYTLVIE